MKFHFRQFLPPWTSKLLGISEFNVSRIMFDIRLIRFCKWIDAVYTLCNTKAEHSFFFCIFASSRIPTISKKTSSQVKFFRSSTLQSIWDWWIIESLVSTQETFNSSKSTRETLEKGVKYIKGNAQFIFLCNPTKKVIVYFCNLGEENF